MKFVDRIKDKVSETKAKVAVARDKKQVKDMVSRLQQFPLCSESDAYWIVEGEVTRYFGRVDCFSLDLSTNPSDEEIEAENENLKVLREQMKTFLEFLFDPSVGYSPELLKGSINVRFNLKILHYLDEVQMPIAESLYMSIIESMIAEGSGADIQESFTDTNKGDGKLDLFTWFNDYKERFFPDIAFIKAGRIAQDKLSFHQEMSETISPFLDMEEEGQQANLTLGNPPIKHALSTDTIGGGQAIKVLPIFEKEFWEMNVGHASVVRIIEYHAPFLLEKNHVLSLRNLSVDIKSDSTLHWHFCEDGIIETRLDINAKPGWIPGNKVKELVFGEAYDGMSKDGVTQFERYYLYMIVRTSIGPTFTLYKYLASKRQKAMEAWADLGDETLPALADYYNIKFSDEVHDVSKHYKTTYTTYTTTWSWE
jgi:hypothetical protein